jgi:hypothetical protein
MYLLLSDFKNGTDLEFFFLLNPGDNVSGSRRLLDCLVTLEDIVRKAGLLQQQKHFYLCFEGTVRLMKNILTQNYLVAGEGGGWPCCDSDPDLLKLDPDSLKPDPYPGILLNPYRMQAVADSRSNPNTDPIRIRI